MARPSGPPPESHRSGRVLGRSMEGKAIMTQVLVLHKLWSADDGQDIAEYAVMLAVILVIVVGTIRLIGGNANNVFSSAASAIQ